MKINTLKLKNFCSIKEANLEFQKGINLIIGNNGQGKTTIYKAVALLLFNWTPSKAKLEDYIKWGEKSYEIEMTCEHEGKSFEIKYKYTSTATRTVMIDDDVFENTAAVEALKKYFDPKLTLHSLISFEGESDLIKIQPSERREQLKKIKNIDFKDEINKIEDKINFLKKEDLISVEKDIAVLESKEYNEKPIKELPFSQTEYSQKKISYNELLTKIELHNEKQKTVNSLEQQKNSKELELISVKNIILNKEQTCNEQKELLSKKQQEFTNLDVIIDNQIKQYETELQKIDDTEIKELQKKCNDLVLKRIPVFDVQTINDAQKNVSTCQANIDNIKSIIQSLNDGICPVCKKEATIQDMNKWNSELKTLEDDLPKLMKILDDRNAEYDTYHLLKKENEDVKELKQKYLNSIEQKKQEINSLQESLQNKIENENQKKITEKKNIQDFIDMIMTNISNLEIDIINQNKQKDILTKELQTITDSLSQYQLEDISAIEVKKNTLEMEIKNYDDTITYNKIAKEHNKEITLEKEKDVAKLKSLYSEKEKIFSDIKEWEEAKNILKKKFPNYLLETFLQIVEKRMNAFIEKTYDGRYKVYIEEKKDAINVLYGPLKKDVSIASGFEKALFSLAYKDALNRMQQLNTVLLDEADHNASEDNSKKMYEYVAGLSELYNQIFIITHRESIKEMMLNDYHAKCYEVEDNNIYEI